MCVRSKVVVRERQGGEEKEEEKQTGVHKLTIEKQEPHTMMWGKTLLPRSLYKLSTKHL